MQSQRPGSGILSMVPHCYAASLGKLDNKSPRTCTRDFDGDQSIDKVTKHTIIRAEGAQHNGFENMSPFASAVVIGNVAIGLWMHSLGPAARIVSFLTGISIIWTFFIETGNAPKDRFSKRSIAEIICGMSYPTVTPIDSPQGYITDPLFQSQQDTVSKHDPLAELNTRFKKLQRSFFACLAEQKKHTTSLREATVGNGMPGDTTRLRQARCIEKIVQEHNKLVVIMAQFDGALIDLLVTINVGGVGRPQAGRFNHIHDSGVGCSHLPAQGHGTAIATADESHETSEHYGTTKYRESFGNTEEAGSTSNASNAGAGSSNVTIQGHGTAFGVASDNWQLLEGVNMDFVEGLTQEEEEHILAATNHLERDQINGGNTDYLKARLAWSDGIGVGSFIGPRTQITGYGEPAVDTNGRLTRDVHFACQPGSHCRDPGHDQRNATYIPHQFTIPMDAINTVEKLLVSGLNTTVCITCRNNTAEYEYDGRLGYCSCKKDRCPTCVSLWVASLQQKSDELLASMGKKWCKDCGISEKTVPYPMCYMCKLPA
ncbi:hypothetical protein AC578_2953 [Pseudocercospora eumusae]|uniref:Uncharacterized protein n=1 Tax=Pseudocercospora eumusae TaxID=321146 RepID=A0A139HEF5_9PEZI|nr:hypothetical protein AC578_2953 [Pseudocercospora eumusae]KXT00782.1 hypothetical protein AC578_2953 [Pseudocercospora eumusae]